MIADLSYLFSWLLFGGLISILMQVGLVFFKAAKGSYNKHFLIGIGLFMVTLAVSTIFWLTNDFLRFDTFETISEEYFFYWRLSNLAIFASLFFLLFSIESLILKKLHHILSILMLTNFPVFLFNSWAIDAATEINFSMIRFKSPFNLFFSYYFVIALNLGILLLVLLYAYMALRQRGDLRIHSIMVLFGIFCVWLGRMTAYREIDPLFMIEELEMILSPILMIVGIYLLYGGYWTFLHGEREKTSPETITEN